MPATKEKSRESSSVFDAGSDSDDSVIHVPFVKPQPPVVVLDVSDNDDDEPTRSVGSKVAENVGSEAPENNVPPPESLVRGVGWAISTRPGTNVEEYQNSSVATEQSPKKKKKKDKKRKESTESSNERKRLKHAESARLLVEFQKKKKEGRRLAKQAKRERKKNNASLASTSPTKKNPVEGSKNNPVEASKKKQRKRKKELESPGSAPDTSIGQIAPDTTESISQPVVDPPETPQTLFETAPSNSKKKPRSKSTSGTDSPTTAEPKRKRTKRKALTAAEKDHLNFLKTLNLTGNIGFDENDMLNMALSPADFIRPPPDKRTQRLAGRVPEDAHDSDTSNTTISTDIDPREINRAIPSQASSPAEAPGPSRPPDSTPNFNIAKSTQTAFVTVTHEKDKRSRKKQSKQKSSSSNTLLAAANIVPTATVPEKPSTTTTTTRNDDDKQTSSHLETQITRPASPTPQTVEVVSVTTEQSKSPTKRKTDSCTKAGEVAADEDEGVFTHQELNELQSSIRLNITGATTSHNPSPSNSHASNANISKDSRTSGSKKTLRYFSVRAEDTEEGRRQSKDSGSVERHSKKRKRDASSPRRAEKSKKVRVSKVISDQAQATAPLLDLARDDAAAVREAENSQGLGYRAFPDTWSDEMKSFYGAVRGSSLDVRQVVSKQDPSPHLWRIPKDLERERRKGKKTRCHNCNQYGYHVAKNCPEPPRKFVCLMCGVEGHATGCMYDDRNYPRNMPRHVGTRCREAMCLTCGRKIHTRRNQFLQACHECQKGNTDRCDCCGQTTHRSAECPDNWRRFHSTTVDYDDEDLQRKVKNNELRDELQKTVYRSQCEMYCANCASKGHSYYHCLASKDLNTPYVTVKPYIVQELPASVRNYRADMVEPGSPSDVIVVSDVESNSAERQAEQVASKRTRSKSDDRLKERKKSAGRRMSKDANSSTSQLNDNSDVPASTAGICERQSGESVQESLAPSVVNPPADKPADTGFMTLEDATRQSSTEKTVEKSMTACATEDVNVTSGDSEGINRPAESKKTEKVPEELNQVIELSSPEVIPLEDSDIEIIEVPESPRSSTDQRAASREKSPKKKTKVLLTGKCVDYPDCSNAVPSTGPPCFRLELTKREHSLLVAFKRRFKIIQKLNAYYARQKLSIDLCEKKKEFHIGGSQYYYARERLVRLVREIKDEKNVYKLLPELFASEAAKKDSVNEAVVSSTTEASSSVDKPSDKGEVRTDGEVVAENTEELNEIEKEGVEAAAQDAVTSHLRPSEKIVEEVANSSTASPLFSRYDFEKKLRRIAVQVAKPSETVTSSEIPSSPQSPTSTSPSTTVEQLNSLEVAEKNLVTQDNIPHEISPVNAQSSSSKSQQPSQVGRSRAAKPTDDARSRYKPFAEDDWDEQLRGGDQSQSNRYERERDRRSRGRNFRGYNSRPSRGRHSRERRRFSPGYRPRGPPPSRPYNNVGYGGPSYPPPHDIDERVMPAGARDMPNPFDSPNSPFSNQWMWIPFGVDPRHGYAPQNYPNDLHVPVNTPDGFAMDRQYFTGPYGTPLYNPDAPMPRPRFPN